MSSPALHLPSRFTMALPSGEVIPGTRQDSFVLEGVLHRYERRGGLMHTVAYRMHQSEEPTHFTLEEQFASRYEGVL